MYSERISLRPIIRQQIANSIHIFLTGTDRYIYSTFFSFDGFRHIGMSQILDFLGEMIAGQYISFDLRNIYSAFPS